jgi:hypothetical protein
MDYETEKVKAALAFARLVTTRDLLPALSIFVGVWVTAEDISGQARSEQAW